jgi:hypothetical protein
MANGQSITFVFHGANAGPNDYHVGDRVQVKYDPSNPNNAEVALPFPSGVVGLDGIVWLILGVFAFVFPVASRIKNASMSNEGVG